MGKQVIILIITFLIVVGVILLRINARQQEAVQALTTSTYEKQTRLLANSLLQARCQELREELDSGSPIAEHKVYANIENITGSIGEARVYSQQYNEHPLPPDHYYVVCTAEVTAHDGAIYKTSTRVLFNHADPSEGLTGWEEQPIEVITP